MDASADISTGGASAINKPANDSGRALTSTPRVKVGARTLPGRATRFPISAAEFRAM